MIRLLSAVLLLGALALPAMAAENGIDWQCKTTQPVGWCPTSNSNPLPINVGPYSASRVTADASVKASAGQVHTVTISPTGSVVAGTVTFYDSTTESGTALLSIALPVTTFTPFSVQLDSSFANGLFVGYDASLANVQVTVSYR